MLTLKQVRSMVFSMLNQSKMSQDLDEVIKEAESIRGYTRHLDEVDRQIEHKLRTEVENIHEARR
jgi:precorrin-3B methylase